MRKIGIGTDPKLNIEQKYKVLKIEYNNLQEACTALMTQNEDIKANYDSLNMDHEKLKTELETLKAGGEKETPVADKKK